MRFTIFLLLPFFCLAQSPAKHLGGPDLAKTYSYRTIHKSLIETIDLPGKEAYFDDGFFNSTLKKMVNNKAFTEKEKVQMFFLMQKKIGFGFIGSEYIPPKQNYFTYHVGKIYTYQKTKLNLKDLRYDVKSLLAIVDSNLTKDGILASNALFLATLVNTDSVLKKLHYYSRGDIILGAKNPEIFNHYVCMAASLVQDTVVVNNLENNLQIFENGAFKEDVLCAIYSRNNGLGLIRQYILNEKNPLNELAIQTAICVVYNKLPAEAAQKNLRNLQEEVPEKWKADIIKSTLANKVPFNYKISSADLLVTKIWSGVNLVQYNNGTLIINGDISEFDPN
jgi:hypothetical protein